MMAMRIPHTKVICFVTIHATEYKGYSYWWNGGTLRQILNLDNDYPNNIAIRLTYMENIKWMLPKEVTTAFNLGQWKKKHIELAWAIVHIMNVVHVGDICTMIFLQTISCFTF